MSALVWIRRDLRLEDHTALAEATRRFDRVALAFIFDRNILDNLEDRDDRRVTFIHESLAEVDQDLAKAGSRLLVAHGDPLEEIPTLARKLGVTTVLANHDFEPYAIQRDAEMQRRLGEIGIAFESFKDHVIFEDREVINQTGGDFRVFTPYYRSWLARLTPQDYAERRVDAGRFWPASDLRTRTGEAYSLPTLESLGFETGSLWLAAGRRGALERLDWFRTRIGNYSTDRDFPAIDGGTSGLSVHLRHGTISIRECVRASLKIDGKGSEKWLSELAWREFYHMIMARFPHVVDRCFRPEFDSVEWENDPRLFQAWCEGRTGYPIVDAAMRCLNETGWMHNRLRMVAASFLTKDLLVTWQWGEAYFARKLLDFELASNNGGWQWAASTGVDAQPHFRIFNPYLQSAKFDAEGSFIRRWLPELAALDSKYLHDPSSAPPMELLSRGVVLGETYPRPIVDHAVQRDRAIAILGAAAKSPVSA